MPSSPTINVFRGDGLKGLLSLLIPGDAEYCLSLLPPCLPRAPHGEAGLGGVCTMSPFRSFPAPRLSPWLVATPKPLLVARDD